MSTHTPVEANETVSDALSRALPVFQTREVFHVGSLVSEHKGKAGNSYEGNGLSVSHHPEEWTAIARLGGEPTWKLSLDSDGRFIDFHSLLPHHLEALDLWARAAGLLEPAQRWEVSYTDTESDTSRFFLVASLEQAQAEVSDLEDEGASYREVAISCATKSLIERCGFDPGGANDLAIAVTIYAEDHGFHGVWWHDSLCPESLSAPRGVINLANLPNWRAECIAEPSRRLRP